MVVESVHDRWVYFVLVLDRLVTFKMVYAALIGVVDDDVQDTGDFVTCQSDRGAWK